MKFNLFRILTLATLCVHCGFIQGIFGLDDSDDDLRTLGLLALLTAGDAWEVYPSTNPLFYASAEKTTCWSEVNATVRCGYVNVPRDREISNNNTMRFAFAVLPRALRATTNTAVIYLSGTPGRSVDQAAAAFQSRYQLVNGDYDIVFTDIRGVRYSDEPACDSGDAVSCYNTEVAAGRTPSGYTFKQTAYDVQALRMALGYENIYIHGQSLGTQLAQAVLKYDDTKSNVLGLALGGARHINNTTANIGSTAQINADFQNSYDLLNAQCAASSTCANFISPQTLQAFYNSVVADFQNNPRIMGVTTDNRLVVLEKKSSAITGTISISRSGGNWIVQEDSTTIHTASATTYSAVLVFTDAIFDDLAPFDDGDRYAYLPFLLKKLMEDDSTLYQLLLTGLSSQIVPSTFGKGNLANFLIGCYESGPGTTSQFGTCPAGFPQATAAELTAPTENIPVLILSGFNDRATSPYRAGTLNTQLPNSYLTTFNFRGHDVALDICAQEAMLTFFRSPANYSAPACVATHNTGSIQYVLDYPPLPTQ